MMKLSKIPFVVPGLLLILILEQASAFEKFRTPWKRHSLDILKMLFPFSVYSTCARNMQENPRSETAYKPQPISIILPSKNFRTIMP